MKNIIVKPGEEIALGKRGENLARCAVFDISDWVTTYGEGTVHLLHQRNGDKIPYPCVVEMENGLVCWVITNTETEIAGRGLVELQYWVDETIAKSATYNTRVAKSMGVAGDVPPEPAENWLETMLGLGTETQANAEIAAESANSAAGSAAEAAASAAFAESVVTDTKGVIEEAIAEALDDIDASVKEATDAASAAAQCVEGMADYVTSAQNAEKGALDAQGAAETAQAAAEKAKEDAQAIVGGKYLPTTGGTLTGPLTLSGDPTENKHAATKQYVDEALVGGEAAAIGPEEPEDATLWIDTDDESEDEPSVQNFTVTVTDTWSEDTLHGGYTQTIAVDGILVTDNPICDVVMGGDVSANELYTAAWGCITYVITSDGNVTLYANGDAPTTAFTMQLKVVR